MYKLNNMSHLKCVLPYGWFKSCVHGRHAMVEWRSQDKLPVQVVWFFWLFWGVGNVFCFSNVCLKILERTNSFVLHSIYTHTQLCIWMHNLYICRSQYDMCRNMLMYASHICIWIDTHNYNIYIHIYIYIYYTHT